MEDEDAEGEVGEKAVGLEHRGGTNGSPRGFGKRRILSYLHVACRMLLSLAEQGSFFFFFFFFFFSFRWF